MGNYPINVLVRSVQKEDFTQWQVLWDGYNAFYGRFGTTALPDEITRVTWTRFFDAYEPVHALVAEYEGEIVGLVHYLFHRSTTQIVPVCYLQDLFTAETVRGKGIGHQLIEAVYQKAKTSGCKRVYWLTQEGNSAGRRLYDHIADKSEFIVYHKFL